MSDDEDDYLSDKFLASLTAAAPSKPKTYSDLRKQAAQKSQLRNEQNRTKSRKLREEEARQEGLNKSLFERAQEEEAAGMGSGNKALAMMMKMGFKPGQSLGAQQVEATGSVSSGSIIPAADSEATTKEHSPSEDPTPAKDAQSHRVEPIPLNEWAGKKGIGLGKRARSPSSSADRIAKMVKLAKNAEEISHQDFRNRAKREYEERQAEGRLGELFRCPAQRTCISLDERAERQFHVLWLHPEKPDSFPPGLLEALTLLGYVGSAASMRSDETLQDRLRRQMKEDALQSLEESGGDDADRALDTKPDPEVIQEALQFLRLQAQDRLHLVLSYLRDNYAYCFWCGVEYADQETMEKECPGPDEESHD